MTIGGVTQVPFFMKIKSQFDLTKLIMDTPSHILGLGSNDKYVLLCICHFMDNKFSCYPSINKLVSISGLSKSTVMRAIKVITNEKILSKENRLCEKGKTSNLYKLNHSTLDRKRHGERNTIKPTKTIIDNGYLAVDGNYYSCAAEYHNKMSKKHDSKKMEKTLPSVSDFKNTRTGTYNW